MWTRKEKGGEKKTNRQKKDIMQKADNVKLNLKNLQQRIYGYVESMQKLTSAKKTATNTGQGIRK